MDWIWCIMICLECSNCEWTYRELLIWLNVSHIRNIEDHVILTSNTPICEFFFSSKDRNLIVSHFTTMVSMTMSDTYSNDVLHTPLHCRRRHNACIKDKLLPRLLVLQDSLVTLTTRVPDSYLDTFGSTLSD